LISQPNGKKEPAKDARKIEDRDETEVGGKKKAEAPLSRRLSKGGLSNRFLRGGESLENCGEKREFTDDCPRENAGLCSTRGTL